MYYIILYLLLSLAALIVIHMYDEEPEHEQAITLALFWPVLLLLAIPLAIGSLGVYISIYVKQIVDTARKE